MASEITIAVSFIVGPLYSNLPRRRVDDFAIELEKLICLKIAPYWNPAHPFSGMHQRCLRVNGPYTDQIIYYAATKSGINYAEIQNLFPKDELKVWVDPGEVSYQIGDSINASGANEVKYLLKRNYPCSETMPPYNSNLATENFNSNIRNGVPYFTVSSFAKTKFGSTKLKHNNMNNNNTNINSSPNLEPVRPNTLKFNTTNNPVQSDSSLPFTPESCSSGMISPNLTNQRNNDLNAINIPCYLPWGLDSNNNTYSNLLTINIPNYANIGGRDSSDVGSVNSELNSPIHGYL